jgi:hypothetical protein
MPAACATWCQSPAPGALLHYVAMDNGKRTLVSDNVGGVEPDLVDELAVLGNGHRDHWSSHGIHQNPSSQTAHSR